MQRFSIADLTRVGRANYALQKSHRQILTLTILSDHGHVEGGREATSKKTERRWQTQSSLSSKVKETSNTKPDSQLMPRFAMFNDYSI